MPAADADIQRQESCMLFDLPLRTAAWRDNFLNEGPGGGVYT
jgi:hypothetical protein